jgi:hypothetical protein
MFGTCFTGALAHSANGIRLLISERCKLSGLMRDEIIGWNVVALVVKAFLPLWMIPTLVIQILRRKIMLTKTQMVHLWFGIKSSI